MAGAYETNSLNWQIQLAQQRFSEWLERLLTPLNQVQPPNWSISPELLQGLFWLIATGLVGWLGWQGMRFVQAWRGSRRLPHRADSIPSVSNPQVSLTPEQWLQRSRALAQQGNYAEACRCLYLAALQHLNDRQLIPQEASLTDGEYLRLLERQPNSQAYQVLIHTHERLCFSQADISAAQFDQCQQACRDLGLV
jgi:hypothetical protein